MKRTIIIQICAILFSVNLTMAQKFSTKMETIFTSEKETARLQHIKSALDNNGNVHLVFLDFNSHITYGTNKSGSWKYKKLEYIDTDYNDTVHVALHPNIAIKNGTIHIVMFGRYREKILYAKKPVTGGEFKFEEIKPSPEPLRFLVYGEYTDMAIDKNNGLHVICRADYTDQKEFKYNQCAIYLNKPGNASKWYLQVLVHDTKWDERNWRHGVNSSIACYGNKVYAALGGDNDLHFGSRNISGGFWDIDKLLHTPDKFINSGKDMTSLAIAPNGSIKIVYHDRADEGGSPYHGLTVLSQSICKGNKWMAYSGFEQPGTKNCPAMAIDNNGKTYIALGQNNFALYHQECDCSGEYVKIFEDNNNSGSYVDMLTDKQNVVHAFYTSDYDNKLHYLKATPQSSTKECNFRPSIRFKGKTNVVPGEEWKGTFTCSDPECDAINIYSIILPDGFNLTDHGNGTATLKGKVLSENLNREDGTGDVSLMVLCNDNKHDQVKNGPHSKAIVKLRITEKGEEKGSVKYENNCSGSGSEKPLGTKVVRNTATTKQSNSANTNTQENEVSASPEQEDEGISGLTGEQSKTCEEYLDKYEAWANKYIPLKKKVNDNPMNVSAVMKLAKLAPELGNWGLEWANKHYCGNDPGFVERFEKIKARIDEVNK